MPDETVQISGDKFTRDKNGNLRLVQNTQTSSPTPRFGNTDFIKVNDANNARISTLRKGYDEGNVNPDKGVESSNLVDMLQQTPFLRQGIKPLLQTATSPDNANPVVKGTYAILQGLLGGVMSPYSEASEAISSTGELGKQTVEGVNRAMNLPFEVAKGVSQGISDLFDMIGLKLPTVGSPETDKMLNDIATTAGTLLLLGHSTEAVKSLINKKYPEIKQIGERNATQERKVEEGSKPEYTGISQGENLPVNEGEIRQGESGQTGGSGGNEPSGNVSQKKTSQDVEGLKRGVLARRNLVPDTFEKNDTRFEGMQGKNILFTNNKTGGTFSIPFDKFNEKTLKETLANDKNPPIESLPEKASKEELSKAFEENKPRKQLEKGASYYVNDIGDVSREPIDKESLTSEKNQLKKEIQTLTSKAKLTDSKETFDRYYKFINDRRDRITQIDNTLLNVDLPKEENNPKVISTAVKKGDQLITGDNPIASHDEIGQQKGIGKPPESRRGFIIQDETGNQKFVGREEAAKIANESGQVEKPVTELHSEDLKPIEQSKKEPIKQGEKRTAKAASDINKQLVRKGFEELPPDEISNYTSITKEDQINKSADLIESDYEASKNMVKTGKGIPRGTNPQVLFNAVKNKALMENDYNTLRDLANSPIARARSKAAQTLGASGFNNGDVGTDPIKAMQDVEKARENNYLKKTGAKDIETLKNRTVDQISKETKKHNLKPTDWTSFLKEIECK